MKKSFLLCLLMTLFTTWAVQASELTVHDGTTTNSNVPMYVFYFDDFTRSQTVFPAEKLANMKNESILSMKFYTSFSSAYTTLSDVDIYLKEVEDATISEFVNKDDATIVYQGNLDFILEDGKATVTIEFTTPFEYNGGNLMFGCDNTTDLEYKNISFYGETASGASIAGYNSSSLDNVSPSQKNFIPKTTFTYGTPPSCPKATGLTFTNVTADNATFSWDAISNVSTWNFAASTEADFPDDADKTFAYNNIPASLVSGNTVDFSWIKTLTGFSLEPNTTYYVKLQANCGADGWGDWSNVASFHTACEAFALPFSEDFEEGIDCWKMVDCKEGSYGTGINNAEKYEGSYSFKFAYNTTPPQYLISPEFVAIDKEVIVEFYFKKGGSYDETFAVGYSTTDNEVGSFTWGEEIHGQSTWEQYLETLPAGVKYVAVKYTANNMLSLYIDNFSVYEVPACPKPTGLAVSNIEAHNATFSWTGESDLGWQLCINDGGDDDIRAFITNPCSVYDLKPETEYTAKLRTLCEGDATSDWSNEVTFTTDIACPAPTNLEVELTPGDGKVASLLWAAAGSAEDWILQYSESAAFESAQEITVNGNSFYDLDDLTPETTYYARVKALCGDEDGDSQWSEPISFTPTDAYSITVNDGTSTNGQVPIYGYWADHLTNSQFIIPAENLESIVYGKISELVFHASQVSASFGAATFEVYVAEVNETTISSLADWSSMEKVMAAASLSIIDNKMVVTFNDPYQYMGGNLMIGFLQTATGSYPSTYWYGKTATGASLGGYDGTASQQNFLPKMTITYIPGEAPSCPKPTGLTIEYNGGTEAVVSWTSDAESWNLEYGDALININQNPYTIQNLALATTYQVRVQALCSVENASDWTNVVEFTTDLCLPEEMKTITYKLTDSYDDGWNGSAALRVVHKTTNTEIASLTLASGASLEGSLDLCCGEEYSFIWKKGSYDTECGFEIYDINGDIILSKEGCNSGCESPNDGAVLLDYTMNCSSGETPTGVEDVKNDAQVYKFVKDGNLFILHNGKLFNAQGKFVK